MASKRNFLLGRGELLTDTIEVVRSGGKKKPPYDLDKAMNRITSMLSSASSNFENLPSDACPNDKIVVQLTMHPRYVSKSDYPSDFMVLARLRAIGGKSVYIIPEQWGVNDHPLGSVTDEPVN